MIPVSNAFRQAMESGNRNYLTKIIITLTDGTKLTVTNSELWSGGLEFEDSVSGSELQLGGAIINKCTITLNNIYDTYTNYNFDNASVVVNIGLETASGVEYFRKGYYYVTEAEGQNSSLVTLECYDRMVLFAKPYSNSTLAYPATLRQIIQNACVDCGISMETSATESNLIYVVSNKPDSENLTYGNIVSSACQIAGCYARVNNNGRLAVEWFDPNSSLYEIDFVQDVNGEIVLDTKNDNVIAKYYDIGHVKHSESTNIDLADITITGVKVINSDSENPIEVVSGTEGYLISIEDNPLIESGREQEAANNAWNNIQNTTMRPMRVSALSDPTIEAGDRLRVNNPKTGESVSTFVTTIRFNISEYEEFSCETKSATQNSLTEYSGNSKIIAKMSKKVALERKARETAIAELADKLDNSNGLYMTVGTAEDGGSIYYLHSLPTMDETKKNKGIIWKMTAEAIAVSTDGGETFPYGFIVDGELITKLLYAEGINADYITSGSILASRIIGDKTDKEDSFIYMSGKVGFDSAVRFLDSVSFGTASSTSTRIVSFGNGTTIRYWGRDANNKALVKLLVTSDQFTVGAFGSIQIGTSDTTSLKMLGNSVKKSFFNDTGWKNLNIRSNCTNYEWEPLAYRIKSGIVYIHGGVIVDTSSSNVIVEASEMQKILPRQNTNFFLPLDDVGYGSGGYANVQINNNGEMKLVYSSLNSNTQYIIFNLSYVINDSLS